MGPGDLTKALAPLPVRADPDILVGRESFDDAGVYRLTSDLALVQTVDFFAPIVDEPRAFGQVAAANALSDVYAMGGEPVTALAIVGFPAGKLPLEILTAIVAGGQDKVHEAGAVLVGGHTILDDELKFGLAVTGRVHPDRILANTAARPGDVLILTKPLGTGLIATAVKRVLAHPDHERAMIESMTTLNRAAARAAVDLGLRCATDVTGFGLLGHASHVARGSDVSLRFHLPSIPTLSGVAEALDAGIRTGGAERNEEYLEPLVAWGPASARDRAVLLDPQTSGGLLVACHPSKVGDYLTRVPGATVIGRVETRGEHLIVLE